MKSEVLKATMVIFAVFGIITIVKAGYHFGVWLKELF